MNCNMAICERTTYRFVMCIIVITTTSVVSVEKVAAYRTDSRTDECALLTATQSDTYTSGQPTFIALGEMDVVDGFSVTMEIFAHPFTHNGILFAVGWQSAFSLTSPVGQYLVLEFIHSSLTLTLKSTTSQFPQMIELSRTTPVPYDIDDLHWHSIKASRHDGNWMVKIDDIAKTQTVSGLTNVQLSNKEAFIGGRPGYDQYQFTGVVRRVRVNNQSVKLSELPTQGHVEIVPCSAIQVEDFITLMKEEKLSYP